MNYSLHDPLKLKSRHSRDDIHPHFQSTLLKVLVEIGSSAARPWFTSITFFICCNNEWIPVNILHCNVVRSDCCLSQHDPYARRCLTEDYLSDIASIQLCLERRCNPFLLAGAQDQTACSSTQGSIIQYTISKEYVLVYMMHNFVLPILFCYSQKILNHLTFFFL